MTGNSSTVAVRSATVRLRDVHVCYRSYDDSTAGLKKLFAQGALRRRYRKVHAVRGVSLELYATETLGLIGANGSGKSTLLAAMTGLLSLESGTIHAISRPALLGVSHALRPSLSGRRNIIIGGLALGFTRAEIKDQLNDIIDFSGVRDAIDRPMSTYSSGMRARLHFAIATARAPEVLLIDEALAVGDEEFRRRSSERMKEICSAAGSVVLVTHNMTEIRNYCDRVAWLDDGVLQAVGAPDEVVAEYLASAKGALRT